MKNILDRYFTHLILKPVNGSEEVVFLGYFDSPSDFKEIIQRISYYLKGKSTLDYFIHSFPHKKPLIQGHSLTIDPNGVVEINSQHFDLKNEHGIEQFIEKHFPVSVSEQHRHYWGSISLEFDNMDESPYILGYFSAVNEFCDVMREVGSHIIDAGHLVLQINDGRTNRKIAYHDYSVQANGDVRLPDDHSTKYNLRDEKDLKSFCLFIWENDFNP